MNQIPNQTQTAPGVATNRLTFPASWRWARIAVCCVLLLCTVAFVAGTLHWRVVNDAAQIDYACFMMDHGMSPYKDMVEMNMPGIYLVNWSVMHGFGSGSLAWRVFDLLILAAAGVAMVFIAIPYDRLAGVFAGVLFALFHGRDGPSQMGQRDLIIATLMLCAVAFLFESLRRNRAGLLFFAGLCGAAATTIKPTAAAFSLFLLAAACLRLRQLNRPILQALVWNITGAALPIAGVYAFLSAKGSLAAFWYVLRRMLPFYARLGRTGLPYLIAHPLTPSLAFLLLLGLAAAVLGRDAWNWERTIIVCGMVFGALSYFAQGTGFPYHRYPLIAFLFLWTGIEFAQVLRKPEPARRAAQWVALAGVVFGLALAPIYTARAMQRTWDESYNRSLQADLTTLAGPGLSSLSGRVLCLTTPGDCDTTLYRLKLVQDSGLFYDYFVFGDGTNPVIAQVRSRIFPVLRSSPPKVIVLDRGLYPNKSGGYEKLQTWPELDGFIARNYTLYADREFRVAECGQRGYRLYVLQEQPASNPTSLRSKLLAGVD